MNPRHLSALIALWTTTCLGGQFQNLDFDSADTRGIAIGPDGVQRGVAAINELLPGWSLTRGTAPQSTLGLNLNLLTYGYGTLVSADRSDEFGYAVEGGYALYLVGTPGNQEPFALSQRGEIPSDAQWLSYKYGGYAFLLEIDGTTLTPQIHTTSMEAFDVSPFRGQDVELTLRPTGPLMPTSAGSSFIDTVAFTIPEPSTVALTVLGCAFVAAEVTRRKRTNLS